MTERVFLSVPLVAVQNSESIRNLYRELAEICREKGFEVYECSDPKKLDTKSAGLILTSVQAV
jgi:hypothetical protein